MRDIWSAETILEGLSEKRAQVTIWPWNPNYSTFTLIWHTDWFLGQKSSSIFLFITILKTKPTKEILLKDNSYQLL